MAEDVRVTAQGPNGDEVRLQVGSKALGLKTTQLPFVVVLVLVGILGVYRIRTHDASLTSIDAHIQALYARQDQHRDAMQALLLGEFTQQREQVRAQTELIQAQQLAMLESLRENREITGGRLQEQNSLLQAQTAQLTKNQEGILVGMQQQTAQLRQWFAAIIHRLHYPDQPVSLDLPLPQERSRQER